MKNPSSSHQKYTVGRELGAGGVGVVYEGMQWMPRRPVAIKVLKEDLARDETARRRFLEEAHICANLSAQVFHPGLVQVLAVEEELFAPVETVNGYLSRPAIVMELLRGETLKQRLARLKASGQPMEESEAFELISQILKTLSLVHNPQIGRIVHRDIKPDNIFLCEAREGELARVVLTDFGIARVADSIRHTKTGEFVGTVDYSSPQQIEGMAVDERSDLYSCGCVLFEMLAGRPPFQAERQVATAYGHMHKPVPALPARVSPKMQKAVKTALAKSVESRFQTADQFLATLHGAPSRAFPLKAVLAAGGAALFLGFLWSAQPRAERITRSEIIAAPAAPLSTSEKFIRVLQKGRDGKREIIVEQTLRFGRTIGERTVSNRVASAPVAPIYERISFQTQTLNPPPTVRKATRQLAKGTEKIQTKGAPGWKQWKIVEKMQGSKTLTTTRAVEKQKPPIAPVILVGTFVKPALPSRIGRDTTPKKERKDRGGSKPKTTKGSKSGVLAEPSIPRE